jgi:hypothetical protein
MIGGVVMTQGVSRRSVLKSVGVGSIGLVGVGGVVRATTSFRAGRLSAAELGQLSRVPEGLRATDRAALGREGVLGRASAPAPAVRLVEYHLSPGEGLDHLGLDVRQFAAEFVCDPRGPNVLVEGVTRLAYEVTEVAWQPGEGWPVYRDRAPCPEPQFGMRYAGVPRHQIVFLDDRAVYVGHPGSVGVIDGLQGPVRVDVNSDCHDAHRGFYKVLITGIA